MDYAILRHLFAIKFNAKSFLQNYANTYFVIYPTVALGNFFLILRYRNANNIILILKRMYKFEGIFFGIFYFLHDEKKISKVLLRTNAFLSPKLQQLFSRHWESRKFWNLYDVNIHADFFS